MRNYSSANLELLMLKWVICEKFNDYLISSKFTVVTENNPLTYVCTSHLGAAQIHCLSDPALFDFEIKYRARKSNQAADALSWQPVNPKFLLSLWMMMRNWKPFLMRWFAKYLTIILTLPNCPTMSNLKSRATLQMLMWLTNL